MSVRAGSSLALRSQMLLGSLRAARVRNTLQRPLNSIVAQKRWAVPGAGSTIRAASTSARRAFHVSAAATAAPATSLDIVIKHGSVAPSAWEGDLLVVGIFEEAVEKIDNKFTSKALSDLDASLGGILTELITDAEFKGKPGSSAVTRLGGKAHRVGIVGLGSAAKPSPRAWKMFGSIAATAAKTAKASTLGLATIGAPALDAAAATDALEAVSAGVFLGAFDDSRFKSKPKPLTLASVEVLEMSTAGAPAVASAKAMAAGVILARRGRGPGVCTRAKCSPQLVNAPPNVVTPTALAVSAAETAAAFPERMTLKVLEKADCEKLGMGSFLGVAEASEEPPKFIHLVYRPEGGPAAKKIGVVGKGLTFDSGGYNIKFDMGGAAATLGAARAVAELAPKGVEVHFIVAACENMVAGKGMRPGDILTASNGKTIEVNNTDGARHSEQRLQHCLAQSPSELFVNPRAEGRLTLADALIFVQKEGVTSVVDIATLTGACMVALGTGVAGLFTPSDELAGALNAAAASAGEKIWRMPLEETYWEQMSSPIADMKNTGMGKGGAITAGLFLKEFIEKDVEWAHLDIAGPVWDEKANSATGFGAATLTEWVLQHASA